MKRETLGRRRASRLAWGQAEAVSEAPWPVHTIPVAYDGPMMKSDKRWRASGWVSDQNQQKERKMTITAGKTKLCGEKCHGVLTARQQLRTTFYTLGTVILPK